MTGATFNYISFWTRRVQNKQKKLKDESVTKTNKSVCNGFARDEAWPKARPGNSSVQGKDDGIRYYFLLGRAGPGSLGIASQAWIFRAGPVVIGIIFFRPASAPCFGHAIDFNLEKNDLMWNQGGFEPTTLKFWVTRSAIWATVSNI